MNNVNSETVSDILSLDRLNRKKIMTMLDKAKRDLNSIRDMVKKLNKYSIHHNKPASMSLT